MEPAAEFDARGQLLRAEDLAPCADVLCHLWIIPPQGNLPGKWGGTLEIVHAYEVLEPTDFAFILQLDDGRRAQIYAEIDLEQRKGSVEGNGPPPA